MRQKGVGRVTRSELSGLGRISVPAQKDPGCEPHSPFIADALICWQKYNFFSDHKSADEKLHKIIWGASNEMHQSRWSRKFQTFDSVNCTMSWDAEDFSV